jgi:hypothetical protein
MLLRVCYYLLLFDSIKRGTSSSVPLVHAVAGHRVLQGRDAPLALWARSVSFRVLSSRQKQLGLTAKPRCKVAGAGSPGIDVIDTGVVHRTPLEATLAVLGLLEVVGFTSEQPYRAAHL